MINFDVSWNYVQPLTKVQKRKVVEQIEQRVNELKSIKRMTTKIKG